MSCSVFSSQLLWLRTFNLNALSSYLLRKYKEMWWMTQFTAGETDPLATFPQWSGNLDGSANCCQNSWNPHILTFLTFTLFCQTFSFLNLTLTRGKFMWSYFFYVKARWCNKNINWCSHSGWNRSTGSSSCMSLRPWQVRVLLLSADIDDVM